MKRALKIVGGILLVLVILVGTIGFVTFGDLKAFADGDSVGSGKTIGDGYVAAFLVETGDGGALLVDAGNDREGKAVLAALAKAKRTPDAVKAVFITHGHPDHLGALAKLPKATIYALAEEAPIIAGKEGTRGPLPKMMGPHQLTGIPAVQPLADGATVTIGDKRVEIFAVPGHTRGSAAYLIDGVLYLGDSASIAKNGSVKPAPWVFTDDTTQNRASLIALAKRLQPRAAEVKWLAPAHTGAAAGLQPLADLK